MHDLDRRKRPRELSLFDRLPASRSQTATQPLHRPDLHNSLTPVSDSIGNVYFIFRLLERGVFPNPLTTRLLRDRARSHPAICNLNNFNMMKTRASLFFCVQPWDFDSGVWKMQQKSGPRGNLQVRCILFMCMELEEW